MIGAPVPGVERVEAELAELWRRTSTEEQPVIRVCMHNLIVCCDPDEDPAEATRQVGEFSEQYPGRAIVVSRGRDERGLGLFVSSHCHLAAGGKQVCSEQINVVGHRDGPGLIPGTVLQLLVGDCPVYTWWRGRELAADPLFSALAALSNRVIVDTGRAERPLSALRDLAALAGDAGFRGHAGDLAWVRLAPWRELIAGLFDADEGREALPWLESVEIRVGAAGAGVGAYLVGWLASRLGWRFDGGAWRRPDGEVLTVRLDVDDTAPAAEVDAVTLATGGDRDAVSFEAARPRPAVGLVRTTVQRKGGRPLPSMHRLEALDDVALLCGHLEGPSLDDVFATALAAAALVPDPSGGGK